MLKYRLSKDNILKFQHSESWFPNDWNITCHHLNKYTTIELEKQLRSEFGTAIEKHTFNIYIFNKHLQCQIS